MKNVIKCVKSIKLLRWFLGLRKLRSSGQIEILQIGLIYEKTLFSIMDERNVFFLIFTMELFSAALSDLTTQSALNFT